jgi:hypothetical protein
MKSEGVVVISLASQTGNFPYATVSIPGLLNPEGESMGGSRQHSTCDLFHVCKFLARLRTPVH